jgi:hypothetical protein
MSLEKSSVPSGTQIRPKLRDNSQKILERLAVGASSSMGEEGVVISGTATFTGPFRALVPFGTDAVVNTATATAGWGGGTVLAGVTLLNGVEYVIGLASVKLTSGTVLAYK